MDLKRIFNVNNINNSNINTGKITINENSYSVSGNNISISNGKVIVDGKVITEGLTGTVNVKFEGDIANLNCGGDVEVIGNVFGDIDCGGSVKCEDVKGSIDCGGSVTCSNVGGNIDAGGSVRVNKM